MQYPIKINSSLSPFMFWSYASRLPLQLGLRAPGGCTVVYSSSARSGGPILYHYEVGRRRYNGRILPNASPRHKATYGDVSRALYRYCRAASALEITPSRVPLVVQAFSRGILRERARRLPFADDAIWAVAVWASAGSDENPSAGAFCFSASTMKK